MGFLPGETKDSSSLTVSKKKLENGPLKNVYASFANKNKIKHIDYIWFFSDMLYLSSNLNLYGIPVEWNPFTSAKTDLV